MYSTCLYCTRDLGKNEILETLPIGRRVAFDAAEGRLWVLCRACEKWNLVPFDTRLETIDACERIFRDTRMRFSTDNIGLARVGEGLELVRIGPALRPEFAAWRYGRQFASRRRRGLAMSAGGSLLSTAVNVVDPAGGLLTLIAVGIWTSLGGQDPREVWRRRSIAMLLPRPDGEQPVVVTRADLDDVRVAVYRDGWEVALTDRRVRPGLRVVDGGILPDLLLRGRDATAALGRVLPMIAGVAGSPAHIQSALEVLEEAPDTDSIVNRHLRARQGSLQRVPPGLRLALEMASHEESEREALRGELKLLEREWRAAEELAKIADGLAVSDEVNERLSS